MRREREDTQEVVVVADVGGRMDAVTVPQEIKDMIALVVGVAR